MNGIEAILSTIENKYTKKSHVNFKPGDTIKVHLKVKEGNKERIQVFEGTVLGRAKSGTREMFRVRRIASGVGVERVFPINSPSIDKIQVVRRGVVNRAKLYYLRDKSGKDGRITEDRVAALADVKERKAEAMKMAEENKKKAEEGRKIAAQKKAEKLAAKKAEKAAKKAEAEAKKAEEEAAAKEAADAKAAEEAEAKKAEEAKAAEAAAAPAEEKKEEAKAEEPAAEDKKEETPAAAE